MPVHGDLAPERGESSTPIAAGDATLVVGIPAYNEEVAIGSIVLQAQRYADEVVVVDDGSTDQTSAIAADAGATVVRHDENKGKGRAIKTIFGHVQRWDVDLDALILLDGDGQHVPDDIRAVVDPILEGDYDMVIGSRYFHRTRNETPLYRRFGQRVLDLLTLGSSGTKLSDTQSGFRAISPDAVSKLNIRTDGMGVESEMINTATEHGLAIKEVPIDVRYDVVDGQTFNPLRHGLSVVVFILQLIRDRNPLLFFGISGLAALLVGGGLAIHSAVLYQTSGAFHQWRFLASGFIILLGTLSVFCGLVLSQMRNILLQSDV